MLDDDVQLSKVLSFLLESRSRPSAAGRRATARGRQKYGSRSRPTRRTTVVANLLEYEDRMKGGFGFLLPLFLLGSSIDQDGSDSSPTAARTSTSLGRSVMAVTDLFLCKSVAVRRTNAVSPCSRSQNRPSQGTDCSATTPTRGFPEKRHSLCSRAMSYSRGQAKSSITLLSLCVCLPPFFLFIPNWK